MMITEEDISELLEGLSLEFSAEQLKDECQILTELEPVLEFEDRLLKVFLAGALEIKTLRGDHGGNHAAIPQIH